MNGLPARDYVIEEYTTTVCPHCFAERRRRADEADVWKDGMLVRRDGKIWMRRFCATHGETESLYEEDAALWHARQGWNAPTLRVTPDRADNFGAFPHAYRDGLPASHGQHTCILLLNVTARCNYSCPACYASALAPGAPSPQPEHPTLAEIRRTVETMLAETETLMISKDTRAQLLSHGLSGVQARHYDKGNHLPAKTDAMRKWNDFVADLCIGPCQESEEH